MEGPTAASVAAGGYAVAACSAAQRCCASKGVPFACELRMCDQWKNSALSLAVLRRRP